MFTQLRERKAEIERELTARQSDAVGFIGADDTEFDHEAWLEAEWEATKDELGEMREIATLDGEVAYDE